MVASAFVTDARRFALVVAAAAYKWFVPFDIPPTPSASPLSGYCEMARDRELVIVSPDDEFYSAVLPLRKVRYVFREPGPPKSVPNLDFRKLGIMVTAEQFNELDRLRPEFAAKLKAMDFDGVEPVATGIVARSAAEVSEIVRHSPDRDFYVPPEFARDAAGHGVLAADGRFFLLARESGTRQPPRGCGL